MPWIHRIILETSSTLAMPRKRERRARFSLRLSYSLPSSFTLSVCHFLLTLAGLLIIYISGFAKDIYLSNFDIVFLYWVSTNFRGEAAITPAELLRQK